MTQITIAHLDAALKSVMIHPDGKYSIVDLFNKAQELAEQPACQVRNDDTGVTETMTRESAKKLQAETPMCDWLCAGVSNGDGSSFTFTTNGIYTYKRKALKPVSWADMPVGVMTNKGEFRRACGVHATVERGNSDGVSSMFYCMDLTLAPADQQNWIVFHGSNPKDIYAAKGIAINIKYVNSELFLLKVIGITEGWELK